MRRAYKFRLRPTRKQETALDACLEDTRQLYNAALDERREAWRMGRRKITFYGQDAQLILQGAEELTAPPVRSASGAQVLGFPTVGRFGAR